MGGIASVLYGGLVYLVFLPTFLYAVAFGGFVAFSTYLPTYLKDVYDWDHPSTQQVASVLTSGASAQSSAGR